MRRPLRALARGAALGLGIAAAACDPGTRRPTFTPRPEAATTELEMAVPAATQALATALAADSIPVARIAQRDGFVESPWLDAATMRPASRRPLGPSVVRLRGWVDPSRYGFSRLTVEVVYRTTVDPSLTPRETETEAPWASPARTRVRTLLAKLGGTPVDEPELLASQATAPRRPDTTRARTAPPPIPSPVSVDSGALLRGTRDSVRSTAPTAAPNQGQRATPPPLITPRRDTTRTDTSRRAARRDSTRPPTVPSDTTGRAGIPRDTTRRALTQGDTAHRAPPRHDTTGSVTVRRDTTLRAAPPRDTTRGQSRVSAPPARRSRWSVQVAASRTRAEADPIAAGLVAGGLPARVATAGGWFKVWVGDYGSAAQADSARRAIRRQRGGAPFVVRE